MAIQVTATEAKARLLQLLDQVESGERIEITRHGRTIARIEPAKGPHALKDMFRGVARTVDPNDDLLSTGVRWNTEE
jgi:prevent-host-death family protein